MNYFNKANLSGKALGAFMLVLGTTVTFPANDAIAQTPEITETETLETIEPESMTERVDYIFELESWHDQQRAFRELRSEIDESEDQTRAFIAALSSWLNDNENMREAAHQLSHLANWQEEENNNAHLFAEELEQPLLGFIEATKGTEDEEAKDRIYIIRVLAHTSPELIQLEIDNITDLLENGDLTTWNEVISSYYIINRNFPVQFEAEVSDALEGPFEELIPYLSHENPNVRYNIADLVGDIGYVSHDYALRAAQALMPLVNDPNEHIREDVFSEISSLCEDYEAAYFILQTYEDLIPDINDLSPNQRYYFLWALEYAGLENPEKLGDRSIYLLQLAAAHMDEDLEYERQQIAEDVLRISGKQLEIQQEQINELVKQGNESDINNLPNIQPE